MQRCLTLWSVSHSPPLSFNFLEPPDPPNVEDPVGGASGMITVRSAPEGTVRSMTSWASGTGVRFGLSIAQLRAMIQEDVVVE